MATTRAAGGVVLVVDEDAAVRRVLTTRLVAEGFYVLQADTLTDLRTGPTDAADVVVASVGAPGEVEPFRAWTDMLLIAMLPRSSNELDIVDVLDCGADEVVVKPFSPRELIARLNALLRRARKTGLPAHRLVFDGLEIDIDAREVAVAGKPVDVPAREFDLLAFLAKSPRQVFTRTQILEHVWGVSEAYVGEATVTEHIRRLRQRIEPDPQHPRFIQTVWSVGYRFQP